jgi:superfamily II DNA or RNA helicase
MSWLQHLRVSLVRERAGRRSFELAITSRLRYRELPALRATGARAVLIEVDDDDSDRELDAFEVELDAPGDDALLGECSHCPQTFGLCVHVTVLGVDLANTSTLREALLAGASGAELRRAAEDAEANRRALAIELRFDKAFGSWVGGTAAGTPVEIAASVSTELTWGRDYGDRRTSEHPAPVIGISVRLPGSRKLLAPPEWANLRFSSRDRSVLNYVSARGLARKTLETRGTFASLALEAMRHHGGIFGPGFRGLLFFRAPLAKPVVELVARDARIPNAPKYDALRAFWSIGEERVPFENTWFFPGPFPYVWLKSGPIVRVAPGVDLDFVRELSLAPELLVPPHRLRETGERLLRAARGRGIDAPTPEVFGLPPQETPRIILRLFGEPLAVGGELSAVYATREVPLLERDGIPEEGRDLEIEERAIARVRELDLVTPGENGETEAVLLNGDRAIALWQSGLLALRASDDPRFEISLSENLANVKIGSPIMPEVNVTLEGGWLATELEFRSKQLKVEIAEIIDALKRKVRFVALNDGTLARISESAERLVEEALGIVNEDGKAKLPPHQLGRLDRWIEENDGTVDAEVEALRKRMRTLAVAEEPKMPRALKATLRPYQRRGLAWLQFLQTLGAGGVLADDMGLGKTITTLAFLLRWKQAEGRAPSLVVCPTSVATNWVREAERFTPSLRVLLLHGPSPRERAGSAMRDYDIVITTYTLLRRDLEALSKVEFRCVILDEAQQVKNAESQTRRAAGQLKATMRIALTGTPVENRLRELWSIGSFVNPGMLGTQAAFENRYEAPIATHAASPPAPDEGGDRPSPLALELRAIVRPFLLRRTKDQVLTELPSKTEIERVVTMSTEDRKLYDALVLTLREAIIKDMDKRRIGTKSLTVFAALTRLRQMACDPRLIDPRLPASRSVKREAFLDLVRELVAEGRRALVFSQFVQILTLWRADLDAEGIAYEYLDGSTTKRDAVISRFQNGKAPLFLISLKAGGSGLNLTAADTVIHCDPWWNPAVEDQATDRAYRIGQDKPVTVVRIVSAGTIEEKIFSLKKKKRALAKAVIGDDASALRGITAEDLSFLLDVPILAKPRRRATAGEATDVRADKLDDVFATDGQVVRLEFVRLVRDARRWLETTGGFEAELARKVGIPVPFASRLLRGEPFPCSRATADRIRQKLREW